MILRRHEILYPVVLIWAFIGIAVQQAATPVVGLAAGLCALVLALVLLGRQGLRVLQLRREHPAT